MPHLNLTVKVLQNHAGMLPRDFTGGVDNGTNTLYFSESNLVVSTGCLLEIRTRPIAALPGSMLINQL